MREGGSDTFLASPELESNDGNPLLPRPFRDLRQISGIIESFDQKADGGDAVVVEQRARYRRRSQAGPIAQCDHDGERHGTPVHGQCDGKVAALREDGHAALDAPATVLVRPQRHTVEIVDEPVAVGSDDGHAARCFEQCRLQAFAGLTGFAEARGVAHGAAGPASGQ